MLPEEVLIENPARKGAVPARPLGDEARGIGMNTIGKIFVFAVLIMSVVFMSFAVAIFASHTNWKKESEHLQEELAKVTEERQQKEAAITKLNEDLAASKAARDRVVAALQAALVEKNSELAELQKKRDDQLTKLDEDIAELTKAKQERDEAEKLIANLRDEIKELQQDLKGMVNRGAELAAKLHQSESELAMASERRDQLEQQVSDARQMLQQNGLSLQRPKNIIPLVDGVVMAVSENLVEVSIGSDDGLQKGHELEVFRADQYLGRLKVVSVTPDRAVVRIMKDYARGIVQRGDRVATRLKLDS
jgi:DNA repair exonuclease SbcCD ATPase subunit